jgi:hypothetical protein
MIHLATRISSLSWRVRNSWADIENSVERDDWLRFGFCSTLDAYILGACHLVRGIKRLSP